jgi:putative ABC transport system permease protein
MAWMKLAWRRLRALWNADRIQAEIDEEMQSHIEMRTEAAVRSGMERTEARRDAERRFGPYNRIREAGYEIRGGGLLEALLYDARIALRMLQRTPGFTVVAVVTLGIGIASTMAMISVAKSILFHSLPFPRADRLVVIFATSPAREIFRDTTSFPDFADWKTLSYSFDNIAAYRTDPFNVTGSAEPERLMGLRASHELFDVLGLAPAIGRSFDRREQEDKIPVALISHGLWMGRFGGVRDVIGKPVVLNDVAHSVIGVLPERFEFPPSVDIDIVVPILERSSRSTGYIRAVGRLKADVPLVKSQDELDLIAKRLEEMYPLTNRGRGVNVVPLQEVAVGDVRIPLLVLLGASVLVLLIGCANVGGLAVARGIARRGEFAVRTALGAGGGRLVRQLLTESAALALLAAAAGTFLAVIARQVLLASISERFTLRAESFEWSILAVGVGMALVTFVLCGIPIALLVCRSDLENALRQGGRGHSIGPAQYRLRGMLVVVQTALTVVLMVGAGLLLKSFMLMQQVDLGFDFTNVITADLVLSKRYEDFERRGTFLKDVLDSIRREPGIDEAAVATDLPYDGGSRETFSIEGSADPGARQGHPAAFNVVSGGYFEALSIPITRGRAFDRNDPAADVDGVVVNQAMAGQFWPGEEAIGKRIRFYYDDNPKHWLSVIGVAGDVRDRRTEPTRGPQVYVSFRQPPHRLRANAAAPVFALVIRSTTDPDRFIPAVRKWVWAVDPNQTVANSRTMEQSLSRTISDRRLYLLLVGSFALIALTVATAGIYGLVSYAAASRTQEIGIRVALGARSRQILTMVVGQGVILLSIGTSIGLVVSFLLTTTLSAFLFGVTPTDPATFIAVILVFGVAALLAMYIPARRASRIDPIQAVHYE